MDYGILNNLHIIIILVVKVNSSGILTCSLLCLILSLFSFGVHFYSFFIFSFLSPLIFLLGLLLSFHFFLIIFSNMRKQLVESKVCTYLQDYQIQFKNYEPYYYRTLTVAPHGDGIS